MKINFNKSLLKRVLMALGVVFLLAHSWMFSAISAPNERSRIYLSVAIVDEHTLSIDTPIKRFGRIYDWARFEGRAYTDKAPGSSFFGVLPYAVARIFTDPEDWTITQLINLMRTWVMLPLGLLGFFVMRRVLYLCFDDEDISDLGAVAWMLGSSAFHYSAAFYGHQIVGIFLLMSLWQILEYENDPTSIWRAALAGFFAGVAGLTEYQAGIPCVFLALFFFTSQWRTFKGYAAFSLGALPCLAALLIYNTLAFGGPLELSYHHLVIKELATLHNEGIGGVKGPQLKLVIPSLFGLHRGILATSPIFICLPLGCLTLWLTGKKRLAILTGLTALFYTLLMISTRAWEGGWSFGPRLVVPGMAFMMIASLAPLARYKTSTPLNVLTKTSIVFGVTYHQLVHLVLPEISPNYKNPLWDAVIPSLQNRVFGPNLISKITNVYTSLWVFLPLGCVVLSLLIWISIPAKNEPNEEDTVDKIPQLQRQIGLTFISVVMGLSLLMGVTHTVGQTPKPRQIKRLHKSLKKWHAYEIRHHRKVQKK